MNRKQFVSGNDEARKFRDWMFNPTPEKRITAEEAKEARAIFQISQENMANMFCVKINDVRRWERSGVWAYTNKEEGPASIIFQVILSKDKMTAKDRKSVLKFFGYNGPKRPTTRTIYSHIEEYNNE